MRKQVVSYRLSDEVRKTVNRLAKRDGITRTELVERAVREYTKRRESNG